MFNAIKGEKGKGIIIIKQDGTTIQRDYSQADIQKALKTPEQADEFNEILIARRLIGDYLERETSRAHLEEKKEAYKEAIKEKKTDG